MNDSGENGANDIAQLIQVARQAEQLLQERAMIEDDARRSATNARNSAKQAWDAVYLAPITLKKERATGLRDSKLWTLIEKAPERP